MIFIVDRQTDPYLNLAAEEYLLHSFSEPVFRIWRNSSCVVIGKNQNALAEIDIDYVKQNGIAVVRRLTGGGAVFHDLGNVNFSFFDTYRPEEGTSDMFRRFTAPILAALQNLGIKTRTPDALCSRLVSLLGGQAVFEGIYRNNDFGHGKPY